MLYYLTIYLQYFSMHVNGPLSLHEAVAFDGISIWRNEAVRPFIVGTNCLTDYHMEQLV